MLISAFVWPVWDGCRVYGTREAGCADSSTVVGVRLQVGCGPVGLPTIGRWGGPWTATAGARSGRFRGNRRDRRMLRWARAAGGGSLRVLPDSGESGAGGNPPPQLRLLPLRRPRSGGQRAGVHGSNLDSGAAASAGTVACSVGHGQSANALAILLPHSIMRWTFPCGWIAAYPRHRTHHDPNFRSRVRSDSRRRRSSHGGR